MDLLSNFVGEHLYAIQNLTVSIFLLTFALQQYTIHGLRKRLDEYEQRR